MSIDREPIVHAEKLWRAPRPRGIRPTRGYRVFQVVNAVILTVVVLATLYPFVNIVARSFSDEAEIIAGRVNLWPRGFDLTAYQLVTSDPMFWANYRNTVVYTVVATAIAMVLTVCYAYVLSKPHLRGRRALITIAVVTMVFPPGLIPQYVLVTSIGLKNTIWAVVLPNAVKPGSDPETAWEEMCIVVLAQMSIVPCRPRDTHCDQGVIGIY